MLDKKILTAMILAALAAGCDPGAAEETAAAERVGAALRGDGEGNPIRPRPAPVLESRRLGSLGYVCDSSECMCDASVPGDCESMLLTGCAGGVGSPDFSCYRSPRDNHIYCKCSKVRDPSRPLCPDRNNPRCDFF
jgi:hypothetical protein